MNLVGIGSRRVLLVGLHSISPLFRLVYLNEVAQRVGVHIRTLVCERKSGSTNSCHNKPRQRARNRAVDEDSTEVATLIAF